MGSAAAILLRIVFTFSVTYLLHVPGLMLVAGIVLFYVACKLLREEESELEWSPAQASRSVLTAVSMIFVADLTMSLDNVLAVAGASGGHWIQMIVGMFISIVFIIVCSRYIAHMMNRFPWLVFVGAAVLALTASQMILSGGEVIGRFVDVYGVRPLVYMGAVGTCLASGLGSKLNLFEKIQAFSRGVLIASGEQTDPAQDNSRQQTAEPGVVILTSLLVEEAVD